jgi:phosphomannomutase
LGAISRRDVLPEFVKHCLSFIDAAALKPLRVAVDTANGMGGLVVPAVFSQVPLDVVPLYFELDGEFPNHPADPIQPANLADLRAAVTEHGCVAGLAFDGDADRVFFVDELGDPVSASLLGAMIARAMLDRHPGARIVYSLTCSRIVPETIVAAGGEPVRTRVGHSFMKQVMAETGSMFGVEHSGHFYLRDHWRAECGVATALLALEVISGTGGSFSEALAPYRRYWGSGEINSTVEDKAGKIEKIASRYSDGRHDRTDGLTVEYDDWWFNVRPSNTEPFLRLNVEHRDAAEGGRRRDELLALIRT